MSHLKTLNENCGVVLPYELERNIFELAAYAFPGHAVKLCTLSIYVQEWMEAIIYETVVLELPILTVELFLRTFQSRPPSFFAKNVKRLYITGVLAFKRAQVILAACTDAVEVTSWVYPHMHKDNLLCQLHPQNLRRLSITLEALWGTSSFAKFTPALFPHLSHLEIVNPPGGYPPLSIDWNGLATLSSLTHFALGTLNFRNHAQFVAPLGQLLDQCSELKVLVIITSDRSMTDELHKSGVDSDERVLVQTEFNGALTVHDYWQGVRKGGPDFWRMADKSLDSRRYSRTNPDTQSTNNSDIPLPPLEQIQ